VSYEPEDHRGPRAGIHGEDLLILLSVVALFILTVFYRDTSWGQGALVAVLILMVVVFWRRFRRVHRAFKGQEDDT
jgi:membrane protein implicated in regulation of membrane protease activity